MQARSDATVSGQSRARPDPMAQIGPRLARKKSRGQQALVPIKEAGTMLGIGRLTTYRLNKDGQLSIRQIGRRTL